MAVVSGERSFDHLVSVGKYRLRHSQPERLRGVEVDYQLEFSWLLDRQIDWLGPVKDLSGVNADLAKCGRDARSIADQPTGRDEFTPRIHCRNGMPRRQRHELHASAVEERIAADEERASLQLGEGGVGGVDLALGA